MSISEADRESLIQYRIERAYEAIEEAELLIDNDKLKLAVSRVYYGMFYILTALALKYNFKTSKHKELVGWFNKNFIKDKKIDQRYGAMMRKAFKSRNDSDYADFIKFEKSDVEKMFLEMKDFIYTIENYIEQS